MGDCRCPRASSGSSHLVTDDGPVRSDVVDVVMIDYCSGAWNEFDGIGLVGR